MGHGRMLFQEFIVSILNNYLMKFKILEANHNGKEFRIKEDYPEVGSYLYVYEAGKCVEDHLQNDIEMCMQMAFEDYEVPLDKWEMKDEN